MNNRLIDNLANQSEKTYTEYFDGRGNITDTYFDREKFAELIVRECMSQIEEVRQIKAGNPGPVYTQGFDDGMFVAIRTIEEHFRVEE
jgi:hypothetical protein